MKEQEDFPMTGQQPPAIDRVYPEGYPIRGIGLALSQDGAHVLMVTSQIAGPGGQPEVIGKPVDITSGFWSTLMTMCPPGETTPIYAKGLKVWEITVKILKEEEQTPVPEEHLTTIGEFKAPARKPLDLDKL